MNHAMTASSPAPSRTKLDRVCSRLHRPVPVPADDPAATTLLIQRFNEDLLRRDSATRTLERWCSRRGPAVTVAARRLDRTARPLPADARCALGVEPGEPVRYRHVELSCAHHVLSHAENWYVPARLTAGMRHALDSTSLPFGTVVAPLRFRRHTISIRLCWPPELHAAGRPEVLRHHAVLSTAEGRPLAYLVESYTADVLGLG